MRNHFLCTTISSFGLCSSTSIYIILDSAVSENRRVTSSIWLHFVRLRDGKGRCRYCKSIIATSAGSTGNLKSHMKLKHPMVSVEREDGESRSSSPSSSATGDESSGRAVYQFILSDILDSDSNPVCSESIVESQTITESAVSGNRRATKAIWHHFVRDNGKAKCRHCQKVVVTSAASIGNLKRHLKVKHPAVSVERQGCSFRSPSSSTTCDVSESSVSRNRGAASAIWHHYTRDEGKAKCRYCQNMIAMSVESTGKMKNHMKLKHPMVFVEPQDRGSRSSSPSPSSSTTGHESSGGAAYQFILPDILDSDSAPFSSESKVDSQTIIGEDVKESLRDSCVRYEKFTEGRTGQAEKYFLPLTQDRPTQQDHVSNRKSPNSLLMLPPQPQKKPKSHCEVPGQKSQPTDVDKVTCYSESKEKRELDGVSYLFLCYEETFRKFHPSTQSVFKIKLAKLFAETEMNELHMQHNSGPHDSKINHDQLSSRVSSSLESTDLPLAFARYGTCTM